MGLTYLIVSDLILYVKIESVFKYNFFELRVLL